MLIFPVPSGTSEVGRSSVVGRRVNTLSIFKVVSFITSSAVSGSLVKGSAKVRSGNTDFVSIEDPSFRAGKTNLVVPVPGGASGVGRLGVVPFGEDALSFNEVVSFVASEAVTVLGMSGALVRNGNAFSISILEPVVGTSQTFLGIPVPDSTSKVGRLGVVGFREEALSVDKVITLVANSAVTVFSMFFALVRDGNADVFSVEDPSS